MNKFKCLYCFSSSEIDVVEIKIQNLPKEAPLTDVYKWLVLPKNMNKVYQLDFKSMMSDGAEEYREFIEGDLKFNQQSGSFKFLGKEYRLSRDDCSELSSETIALIDSFLTSDVNCDLFSFRELRPSDVVSFKEWIFDKEVIRYSMTKFHRITQKEQVIDWFHSILFDSKAFQLAITDRITKKIIGYAGIAALNEIDRNGEYFIFIGDKNFWRKGIASAVTKEIVKIGFQKFDLHRIFLTASSSNPGALKAYVKAGFIHEGVMREAFYRNGEHSDKVVMGMLRSEFTPS